MRNNIFTGVVMTVIAGGFLALVFCAVPSFAKAAYEPQTIVDTNANINASFDPTVESRVIAMNTVEYIEKPVTEVKYVDRVEKVPVELRNYNSLEELSQWLKEVYANTTTIYFDQPGATVDCDDFALTLQQKALADGYLMSFQIIEPCTYDSLFQNSKLPPGTLHAIDLAIIGNNVYYIEPQTGEVVLAAQLD